MTRRHKAYGRTYSKGKVAAVAWANSISTPDITLWYFMLCGNYKELPRHINEGAAAGFPRSSLMIFEESKVTYNGLINSNLLPSNQIIHDDIGDYLHCGVGAVDLDFATTWCNDYRNIVARAITEQIPNIRITICTRRGPMTDTKNKWKRRLRYMTDQYDIHILPYRGVGNSPMCMAILNLIP